MKSDQWNDIIDINLNSNFYIIKEILPFMIKNKRGNIIGISSVVAVTKLGVQDSMPYRKEIDVLLKNHNL